MPKICHVNSQIVVHKAFMGWVTMGYAKLFIMDMRDAGNDCVLIEFSVKNI